MVKKIDDSNPLPKFKKHSQLKRYEILNFKNFKVFFKIKNFEESFTTWKWGAMCMTYKKNLYVMLLKKTLSS